MFASVSMNQAAFWAPSTHTWPIVFSPGKSKSSNVTPAPCNSAMLLAMSGSLKLTAVWSALMPPAFGNSASVAPEQS